MRGQLAGIRLIFLASAMVCGTLSSVMTLQRALWLSPLVFPESVTYRFSVKTTATAGELIDAASGTSTHLDRGFYVILIPPNISCETQNGPVSTSGGILLVAAGGASGDIAVCSKRAINDGVLHQIAVTFTRDAVILLVDHQAELTHRHVVGLGMIIRTPTFGEGKWALPLRGSVFEPTITTEAHYPLPRNGENETLP
jgi:hypothetical protein